MPVRKEEDGQGKGHSFREVKGKRYPVVFDEDVLENIPNFKSRPDDILLTGYLRSGTHWLFEMIHMLLSGKAETIPMWKGEQMLEFSSQSSLDLATCTRVLNTHLCYPELPQSLQDHKIVHVVRNPRDVAASYYKLYTDIKAGSEFTGDWGYFLDIFVKGKVQWGSWFDYVNAWNRAMSMNSLNIIVVYYEDIHKDPVGTLQRLSEFLGVAAGDKLMRDIAEKCRFDNMVTDKEKYTFIAEGKNVMYRKGVIGDWKNLFSVSQAEMFDRLLLEQVGDNKLVERYLPLKGLSQSQQSER